VSLSLDCSIVLTLSVSAMTRLSQTLPVILSYVLTFEPEPVSDWFWCLSSFHRIAWHSFGRKPCARHRHSLCFQRNHRNNFGLFNRSQASAEFRNEILAVPHRKRSLGLGAAATRFGVLRQRGRKRETHMNFNQLTIIGFIGQNADTKQLASGTTVTKFSVATTGSWKDDKGEWKQRTQWHNVLAFGHGFAQMASRFVKGAHVFVQGELTTREYDRTISVPSGKKSIERVIQQLAVELKADTIRILDRSANSEPSEVNSRARRGRRPPLRGTSCVSAKVRVGKCLRCEPAAINARFRVKSRFGSSEM
jgi:single-strand DNA-binding protein